MSCHSSGLRHCCQYTVNVNLKHSASGFLSHSMVNWRLIISGLQRYQELCCGVDHETCVTLPVSTAECEMGFNWINLVCNEFWSTITVKHLSSLMFVSLVGPPLRVWNPEPHVWSWLASWRRNVAATNCTSHREIERPVQIQPDSLCESCCNWIQWHW